MTNTEEQTQPTTQKVSLPTLTAMVVGSMIGSGVFLLPRRFGAETGVLGAIIAWTIAGTGMLMLAFVFQRLATRKPDLDAGIFAYAKAGFGDYVGFNSAIGYWASACAGNTSYWVLITATLSAVVPGFGAGDTVLAVVVSAIGVWLFVFLVLRGVKDAAVINYIVTIAKVVPILVFIVIAIIAFKADTFADNFWGGEEYSFSSLWDQATGTMLITVFVFLGIEGASVYSRMARKREDVGRATVVGFLSVLSVFALVTLVSYGVMPQGELAGVSQPSMAAVLESVVGHWGSIFIRVGVIVSVLGAYLAWTLMAAEVLYIPAKSEDMPRFLARTNRHGAPVTALIMAGGADFTVARRAAVRRGCARFHAGPDCGAVPDSLSPCRGIRAQADDHSGDLRRQVACFGHGHRRGGDGVHVVPDICRGSRQAPAVVHLVRAGSGALLQGTPRTRSACVHTVRGGAVRRDCPRGGRGCGVLGNWGD
jgi:arginine:ornithine antiporter/lysine permease